MTSTLTKEAIHREYTVLAPPDEGDGVLLSSLTGEEQKIHDMLETLPSSLLNHSRTPRWKQALLSAAMWISPFLIVTVLPTIAVVGIQAEINFWIAIATMLGFTGVMLGAVFFLEKVRERFRISCTKKAVVFFRKDLIKKATFWMASPVLKGRMSELYFLCDHNNIDRLYWIKMNDTLQYFITQMEKQNRQEIQDRDMVELRNHHRLISKDPI